MERLSRSDILEARLRATLTRNGFQPETVERVVLVLKERKLLNDSKTIDSLVAQQTGKRAAGIEKMRQELLAKGVPEELVQGRLAQVSPESQLEGMRAVLQAKCKPGDSRTKGARLLLSRGFDEDAIGAALDEFFGTEDFPD